MVLAASILVFQTGGTGSNPAIRFRVGDLYYVSVFLENACAEPNKQAKSF